jgi:hypothetical protein
MFGEVGFEAFRQLAPREHDAPTAAFALQPDIGAETRHDPLVRAARVRLTQSQKVVETKVGEHCGGYRIFAQPGAGRIE